MKKAIKETAKKIYKTGFFKIIDISETSISFTHFDRIFSLQFIPNMGISGLYRSGYVHNYEVLDTTFESDYKSLGIIKKSLFCPDFEQLTDNPDYVLRASLSLIGLDHLNRK